MKTDECCGSCRWHKYNQEKEDWYCDNHHADEYTDFTPWEYICWDCWEAKDD